VRAGVAAMVLAIIGLEAAHTATAIALHRVPMGHDGFQYFTLQYFFLNNAIQSGELAQWIPYMSQGTVATQWYGVQGSLLQNALLPVAPLLQKIDLLTVFHVGMFVDQMICSSEPGCRPPILPLLPSSSPSASSDRRWLDQPWNVRLYGAAARAGPAIDFWRQAAGGGSFSGQPLAPGHRQPALSFRSPRLRCSCFARLRGVRVGSDPSLPERAGSTDLGERHFFVAAYACLVIGTSGLVTYSTDPGRQHDWTGS
jgi:hypothetical protein